ncbi:hypothetical protein KOW79_017055 [Hemibagrus wyckioides]|uniref:Uncharacterized protein n=1 Tax=Hemibagrus wyckioides TaxID=337641 RepID=A0A9D3SDB1_9TELE|nr:hypothetical protein KOW79_017055 [Hemibagrus wyckioides]
MTGKQGLFRCNETEPEYTVGIKPSQSLPHALLYVSWPEKCSGSAGDSGLYVGEHQEQIFINLRLECSRKRWQSDMVAVATSQTCFGFWAPPGEER